MADQTAGIPAWKTHPATAGAMMLLGGYCEPATACDACAQPLADADGIIDVAFKGREARFRCAGCGHESIRRLKVPGRPSG